MFALTRAEQRTIVVIVLALLIFTLAKHYRETGRVMPASPTAPPKVSATPSSVEEERPDADDTR
jgi:hypothetical protein